MKPFLRTTLATVILGGIVVLGIWGLIFRENEIRIAQLEAANAKLQQMVEKREAMIDRLSRSRRVANIQIQAQKIDEDGNIEETDLLFIELDEQGSELARQQFTIPGDVLFIDGWTVKYFPDQVAQGDPLHGRTILLLRRLYSDQMAPRDGFVIDTPGAVPPGYAAGEIGKFEQMIWQQFWRLATDAELAASMSVRVAQGEAVYKPVREGQVYELIVDAVGGMSLTPMTDDGMVLSKTDE